MSDSMTFDALPLHANLQRGLADLGFTRPTPVQARAIPPALEGRDILGCAMTGSGKTAAFLLPLLHALHDRPRGTTRALILVPTRELAAQVLEVCEELAVHTPVTAAAVFGGVSMGPQEHAFRSGVDILVATPGRLLDHLSQPYASLASIEHLVFDEADRMLDMGFLPDIKRVLRQVPESRRTMLFSATMPNQILGLARELLRDPATIDVERRAAPAHGITQAVYPVPDDLKVHLLVHLLTRGDIDEALVFTRTKHRANRVTEQLVAAGIRAERIHGNRSQSARTAALAGFKDGAVRVLVATDIAARGIDIDALGHVVNLDVPVQSEDYIHRVGRTARAEATGDAFTFVAPEEEKELRDIERAISKRLPRVILPDFDYKQKPKEKLEIPIADRIAEIRARKREERARAAEKAARKAERLAADEARRTEKSARPAPKAQAAGRGPGPTGRSGGAAGGSPSGTGEGGRGSGSSSGSGSGGSRRRRRGGRRRSGGGGGGGGGGGSRGGSGGGAGPSAG